MDVHDRDIQVRSEAIGMLKAGITQINVARELQGTIRTVNDGVVVTGMAKVLRQSRSGRPHKLNRVNKMVIAKTINKENCPENH